MRRMGVKEPHPKIALDFFDLAQERGERRAASGIDRLTRAGLFAPTNPFRNRLYPG